MSGNQCWGTPGYIYDPLDKVFDFALDVCAGPTNAKCKRYLGAPRLKKYAIRYLMKPFGPLGAEIAGIDGLTNSWTPNAWNWCNPPYSDAHAWIEKAIEQAKTNRASSAVLTHHCYDVDWFSLVEPYLAELWFADVRIQFDTPKGQVTASGNNRPNMLSLITPLSVRAQEGPTLKAWRPGKPKTKKRRIA